MGEYISLNEILILANNAYNCNLRQVPKKRIIF